MFYKAEYHIMGENPKKDTSVHAKVIELIQPWSSDAYFLITDKIFPIETGCIFLLNSFETRCVNTEDINKFCRNKIIISSDYLTEIFQKLQIPESAITFLQKNPVFYFNEQEKAQYELDALFKKATQAYNSSSSLALAEFTAATLDIFIFLFKRSKKNVPVFISNAKPINMAIEYINDNLNNENLDLDTICQNVHTNKYHLCHTFKENTGISVMKYIKERRINQAKRLIVETDMKIHDIGEMVGYANTSLFCKIFKQEVGCSPLKYRNR